MRDVRLVVALDAKTGERLWQKPLDLTECARRGPADSDRLMAMYNDGVLLLCAAMSNGHAWDAFLAGKFSEISMVALSAADGQVKWLKKLGYRIRPVVIGDAIYAEPWAFDLHTGEQKTRSHPITGEDATWQMARPGHHCGFISASTNCLFYRSGCIAYYDLSTDSGTMHFGGQRPGCAVNVIPADGLVVIPEASAGCTCPYPLANTVVLAPSKAGRMWAAFSAPGDLTPVQRLALNLGAPGDRRDANGTLWIGYPRVAFRNRPLVLDLQFETALFPGGRYYDLNPDAVRIAGTETPWLFTSGVVGFRQIRLPLAPQGSRPALYTVRLGFAEPTHERAGQRVFDVVLNGEVVLKSFDVFAAAKGRNAAVVKEFRDVRAADALTISLVPASANPSVERAPVLNCIEVVRARAPADARAATPRASPAAQPGIPRDHQRQKPL